MSKSECLKAQMLIKEGEIKEGEKMKCPLLNAEVRGEEKHAISTYSDCLKEECAWWDKAGVCCSVLRLPYVLDWVNASLLTIAKELTMLRPKEKR